MTTFMTYQEIRKMAVGKKIKNAQKLSKDRAGKSVKS